MNIINIKKYGNSHKIMKILVLMTTFLVIELIIRTLRIVLFLRRIVLRIQNPVKDFSKMVIGLP